MRDVATQARAEASRRNGRRGRGPITIEGKVRSSRNAVRHGILTANVYAGESRDQRTAFVALLDQLRAELAPSSTLESLVVERIAAALWRTRRVLAFEAGTAMERDNTPEPQLDRLLRDLNSGRPSDNAGFERGRVLARALAPPNAVDLVVRYEAHLTREVGRLLAQLEQARSLTALAACDGLTPIE